MDEKLNIRPLQNSDLENGFFQLLSQLTEAPTLSREQFDRLLQQQRDIGMQLTLVAENSSNRVLGSASVMIEPKFIRAGRPCAHIEDVVVDASLRGSGIGRQLIQRLVSFAKQKGCYKVILDCMNENVPFYHKCGFQSKGTQMAIYM